MVRVSQQGPRGGTMNHSVLTRGIVPFSQLPDEAFIRQKTLLQQGLIPWSAASLWRKCRSKKFPQPVKISPGITAWRVRDIREWLADPAGYGSASADEKSTQCDAKQAGPKSAALKKARISSATSANRLEHAAVPLPEEALRDGHSALHFSKRRYETP